MSSEEEAAAANVLSQMAQIQQPQAQGDSAEAVISVAHHCDIETTASVTSLAQITDVEVVDVQVLPQAFTVPPSEITKLTEPTTTVITESPRIDNTKISAGGKVYQCEYCGKLFNKSYNLKTHIRVHTGERPYQCEVCGHGFANFGDLKRHSRTHTGEKPFQCEYCGKVFSDFGSHKRHLRLHTGYRPFKCEQCGREFTRLDSFKNHSRLHTGARPYKCDQCLKEFNYLTTYKRHLNIHKGEKPYPCSKCPKKFTRLSYLRNHLMIHENKEGDLDAESIKDDLTSTSETGAVTSQNDQTHESLDSTSNENEVTKTTIEEEGTNSNEDPTVENNHRKCSETLLQQVNELLASGDQDEDHDHVTGDDSQTLTQQFILAQQILSQATLDQQVTVTTTDDTNEEGKLETGLVTTSTSDSLSSHMLAQQIISQTQIPTLIETANGQRIIIQTSQARDDKGDMGSQLLIAHPDAQGMAGEEVVMSEVLENGVQVAVTTQGMVPPGTEAVYVAIDPSRPEMQQLLQQINAMNSQE